MNYCICVPVPQKPYRGWSRDFPLTSFPEPRTGIDFPEQGIWWVHPTPKPIAGTDYDPQTHTVVEGMAVYDELTSKYVQTWTIVPIPPVIETWPSQCTRRQGRLALLQTEATPGMSMLELVELTIEQIEDPIEKMKAQIEYENNYWEYDSPFLQDMWISLGGTLEDLKELFRLAATL